jgi:DNA ligase-1
MSKFSPMLLPRETPNLDTLQYPVYVTPKLDGIRCLIKDGVALSRTLKPIPNKHIQEWAYKYADELEGMDGELIVGSPTSHSVYRDTNSFVMSYDKIGEFFFYQFDFWDTPEECYEDRVSCEINPELPDNYGRLIKYLVYDTDQLIAKEELCLEKGFEGVIIRNPQGKYKYGRCTIKEANAFKLKRFEDDEATIIGFEEEMHNGNNAEVNELGRTKRSTAAAGLHGKGTLGAFICKTRDGIEFKIGSGFDAEDRRSFWERKSDLLGHIVKYKHFPVGVKDKPRHPIFLGFRDPIDM